MDEPTSRVGIVTGASRGIGMAIAEALAGEFSGLGLVARTKESLRSVADRVESRGCKAHVIDIDLARPTAGREVIESTIDAFGQIDCLVNNAGISAPASVIDAELSLWDEVLAVNLRTPIHLSRHAAPYLTKSPRGMIVFISSIAGLMTYKSGGIYSATKHGLRGFAGCVFEDLREYGVKVVTIFPGYVATDMTADDPLDRAKMIQPEDIANAVMYAVDGSSTSCPIEITLRPQTDPRTGNARSKR